VVAVDYRIDGLHLLQVLEQSVEVGLQDFIEHIVNVVFVELKLAVSQGVSLLEYFLNVILFGLLVFSPCIFKAFLNVLAEK
jgi:hypothetical protein